MSASLGPSPALASIDAANAAGIRLIRTLAIPGFPGGGSSQCSVAFSPDGSRLAGACGQEGLPIWDPSTGELVTAIPTPSMGVVAVAFSPDGRTVAAGGSAGRIALFDAAAGAPTGTLGPVPYPTWEIAFSCASTSAGCAGGDALASAQFANGMTYPADARSGMLDWDMANGALRWSGGPAAARVLSVAVSPDGRGVAYGSFEDVRVLDGSTGEDIRILPVGSHVGDVAFAPDGRSLAAGCDDHLVRIWATDGPDDPTTLRGHAGYVNGVAFTPDGSLLVTGSQDRSVGVWDIATGRRLATLEGHARDVLRVAVDPTGRLLASIGWDGTVRLWGVPE